MQWLQHRTTRPAIAPPPPRGAAVAPPAPPQAHSPEGPPPASSSASSPSPNRTKGGGCAGVLPLEHGGAAPPVGEGYPLAEVGQGECAGRGGQEGGGEGGKEVGKEVARCLAEGVQPQEIQGVKEEGDVNRFRSRSRMWRWIWRSSEGGSEGGAKGVRGCGAGGKGGAVISGL